MVETANERPAAWPEFLECAESSVARSRLKGKLRRIQKAHRTGNRVQIWHLIRQYLRSLDACLAATRLARGRMHWDRRPRKDQVRSIAENLNAYQGTSEEVRLILIPKGPVKFRPTLDFGIENRALQYLVLSVLYAIAELHPRQFATRGGVPGAMTQVIKGGQGRQPPRTRNRHHGLLSELGREQVGGIDPASEEGDRESAALRAPEYRP
jgi:hypothetical protein